MRRRRRRSMRRGIGGRRPRGRCLDTDAAASLPERMASSEHRLQAAVEVTSRHWRPPPATVPTICLGQGGGPPSNKGLRGKLQLRKCRRQLRHRLGRAFCSRYLQPSIKMESLQLAVAEDPLGPGALMLALAIFPDCPALHSIHGCRCCTGLGYLLRIPPAKHQRGISATCRCRRSIGALLLALANKAMFLACPALHSVQGSACCSGYLLPSIQTESLQPVVAEDPLEPCCWLWR